MIERRLAIAGWSKSCTVPSTARTSSGSPISRMALPVCTGDTRTRLPKASLITVAMVAGRTCRSSTYWKTGRSPAGTSASARERMIEGACWASVALGMIWSTPPRSVTAIP